MRTQKWDLYTYGPFFRTQCGVNVHKYLRPVKWGRIEMLGCKVNMTASSLLLAKGTGEVAQRVLLLLNIVQNEMC